MHTSSSVSDSWDGTSPHIPGQSHFGQPCAGSHCGLCSPTVPIKYSWQPICCLDSGQGIWWVHCPTVLWDTGIHSLQESGCCYWNHRDSANGWFENGPYGYSPDIQTLCLECWLGNEKSLQLQPLYLNWIWAALQGCRCSSSTPPHTACILGYRLLPPSSSQRAYRDSFHCAIAHLCGSSHSRRNKTSNYVYWTS